MNIVTPGRLTIRGFEDFQSIGSGGFSEVFEARQADLNRQVAIKIIKPAEEGWLDRRAFVQECQAMGAVSNHPNIVTLYSHGFTDQGQPYLSMELYEETLLDRLRRSGRLQADDVLTIGKALASAVRRAHEDGIIHCDIKPQNVFFSEYGEAALGDFGIAALTTGPEGVQTAGVTLHYAAPEVLDDDPPSELSDIYSLGATLYTALAGRQPFRTEGPSEAADVVRRRVLHDPVPPITTQDVPPELEALVRRMLEKDPTRRPGSAGEVERSLEAMSKRPAVDPNSTIPRGALPTVPPRRPVAEPVLVAPEPVDSTVDLPPVSDDPTVSVAVPSTPDTAGLSPRAMIALAVVAIIVLSTIAAMLVLRNGTGDTVAEAEDPLDLPESTPTVPTVPSAPETPTGLGLERLDSGQVRVTWDAVDGAARYDLRVREIGDTTMTDTETVVTTTADLEVIAPDTRVCVEVRALNERSQFSEWSEDRCDG